MWGMGVDPDEVIRTLAKLGTSWKRSGDDVINFSASGIFTKCKAWYHFVSAKLLPSGNLSEVTKEREILNYAIQRGLSIDVGLGIYNGILHTLHGSTTGGLGHPSMIYELCLKGGVVTHPSKEVIHLKPVITRDRTWKFMSRLGSLSAPPSEQFERSSTSRRAPPANDSTMDLAAQMHSMQLHSLQHSMTGQFQYQNDFNSVLTRTILSLNHLSRMIAHHTQLTLGMTPLTSDTFHVF